MHETQCEASATALPHPVICANRIATDVPATTQIISDYHKDEDEHQCRQDDQVREEALEPTSLFFEDQACPKAPIGFIGNFIELEIVFQLHNVIVPLQEVVFLVQKQEYKVAHIEQPVLKVEDAWVDARLAAD